MTLIRTWTPGMQKPVWRFPDGKPIDPNAALLCGCSTRNVLQTCMRCYTCRSHCKCWREKGA